jgi:trehalose 2-sulfotransferase
VQVEQGKDKGPIRYVIDERLDYNHFGRLKKSYIVASSYRSGSQYLCWRLWQTGLLGAPSEILNPTSELRLLMNRLKASTPADYIEKLVARRCTRNGVFGIKAHFHHFEAFQNEYPELLQVLAPTTYIYIDRDDKIAQAVSMAKALQTGAWTSRMEEGPKPALVYDRQTIEHCLADIERQDLNWRRWFEAHGVTPYHVSYTDLTANPTRVVRSIVKFLGVENDEPDEVNVPAAKKQADETNLEWIERFQRETAASRANANGGGRVGIADTAASPAVEPGVAHFFDRHSALIRSLPTGAASATGFLDVLRLRRQYDTIVAPNRDLFGGRRVLDLMSGHGFWSLAALDAGAAHVTGIESSSKLRESAVKAFNECGVAPQSFNFVDSQVFAALRTFAPESFDLVLCFGFLEKADGRQLFRELRRLRPARILLDTGIVQGEGPIVRLTVEMDQARGVNNVLGTPNHGLIMFLCDAFGFRWRLIDWRALGISNWTGIGDYQHDRRRTYVLEQAS